MNVTRHIVWSKTEPDQAVSDCERFLLTCFGEVFSGAVKQKGKPDLILRMGTQRECIEACEGYRFPAVIIPPICEYRPGAP